MVSHERGREVHVSRQRCPFCHDDVRPDDEKVACDGCMAWQHAECFRSHGTCAACGFAGPPSMPVAPDRTPVAPAVKPVEPVERVKLVAPVDTRPECIRSGCGCAARPGFRTCVNHDASQGANVVLGLGLAGLTLFYGLHRVLRGHPGGDDGVLLALALMFGVIPALFGLGRHFRARRERA